ncbi:hypothetical protein [Clostridium frigidicarnis]|uniref:Uncharacterized protein n=1 Tax=Clostridium frigidicarnis TaxID=84698 RepID=A0A1I0ZUE3_9CLOT|nr:hypothetical protein [Clostridium frigidicarnis]SFB29151.1 hypothetical protein SAMN04488528_102523 [Clostridium frigidicarnis]
MNKCTSICILILSLAFTLFLLFSIYKKLNIPELIANKSRIKTPWKRFLINFFICISVSTIWIGVCEMFSIHEYTFRVVQGIVIGIFLSFIPEFVSNSYKF